MISTSLIVIFAFRRFHNGLGAKEHARKSLTVKNGLQGEGCLTFGV